MKARSARSDCVTRKFNSPAPARQLGERPARVPVQVSTTQLPRQNPCTLGTLGAVGELQPMVRRASRARAWLPFRQLRRHLIEQPIRLVAQAVVEAVRDVVHAHEEGPSGFVSVPTAWIRILA